jgi:hypothetical protein
MVCQVCSPLHDAFPAILLTLLRVFSTPILKFAIEKATGWRVWDDVSVTSNSGDWKLISKQKAQRQILKSRLRPNGKEGVRDDTTLIEHLCRNNVQQEMFGGGGFCRLALVSRSQHL